MSKVMFIISMAMTVMLFHNCSSFVKVKPAFNQDQLSNSDCDELVTLIYNNWLKSRYSNYYSAKDDFLTILQRDYRKCLMNLNRDQIIKLFGYPVDNDEGNAFYFLNGSCIDVLPEKCSVFVFYFDDDTGLVFEYLPQPYGFSH